MTGNWGPREISSGHHPAAANNKQRRERLAAEFAGQTLVIPSGGLKVRANDTDFRFRPGTDFYYLTGCSEPDSVLVLNPRAGGSHATLFIAPRRNQSTHEFFTNARYGELWVGPRRGVEEARDYYQIDTAPRESLEGFLAGLTDTKILTLRDMDVTVDALSTPDDGDARLAQFLSEMRLVKDEFEVAQLREAIAHTVRGFEDVARVLPIARARGERVIEGIFNLRARLGGNDVGYSTIAASGSNATVLHWTENDGTVREGDLLLLDAGVECNELYTADVTRTLPVSGTFSPAQRRIYELVYAAQEAGIAAVRPGAPFSAAHEAAMDVLAAGLYELGIITDAPEVSRRKDQQLYRRYTLHGVSHMLGLDVHDCASARNEVYLGNLEAGYVLTVEPGLYFQPNDETVPEEYRGIGVRIEDDILVTADGAHNLSSALPRQIDEVEAWIAAQWKRGTPELGL